MFKVIDSLLIQYFASKLLKNRLRMPQASFQQNQSRSDHPYFIFYIKYFNATKNDIYNTAEKLCFKYRFMLFINNLLKKNQLNREKKIIQTVNKIIDMINFDLFKNQISVNRIIFNINELNLENILITVINKNNKLITINKYNLNLNTISKNLYIESRKWINNENVNKKTQITLSDKIFHFFHKNNKKDNLFFIKTIMPNATNNFCNYYNTIIKTPTNEIDLSLLAYSILTPTHLDISTSQLKRITTLSPLTYEWINHDQLNQYLIRNLIPEKYNHPLNFILNIVFKNMKENKVLDLANQIIKTLVTEDNTDLEFNNLNLELLFLIKNKLFKNYDYNQLEKLFSSRYYYVLYPILIIKIFDQLSSNQIVIENLEPLPILSKFEELVQFIVPSKKILNKNLLLIDKKIISNLRINILQSADSFKSAGNDFNNCILSFLTNEDSDFITFYDEKTNTPLVCMAIKSNKIHSELGISNTQIIDAKIIDSVHNILMLNNIIEPQYC